MSRRKIRVAAAVTIVGGFIAIGAVNSFAAAPLATATSGHDAAEASAAGVPGVVTVSDSTAGGGTASWSAVSLLGTNLYGTDSSNHPTGELSALGSVLGMVNAQTCNPTTGGPLAAEGVVSCLGLLQGVAEGNSDGSQAGGQVLLLGAEATEGGMPVAVGVGVLPSNAYHVGCRSQSVAWLLAGNAEVNGLHPLNIGQASSASNDCE